MSVKTLNVKKNILSANAEKAQEIRQLIDKNNIIMINIMSSPGSGKTTLLLKTINHFKNKFNIAVIEGDIASSIDTDKISGQDIPAVQINTSGGCHLDSKMIEKAFKSIDLKKIDLIFIENVGNLVCTADFDLGAHKNIVILSIPEGDDKPYKYPIIFSEADLVLISKIDVLPYFDFNVANFIDLINGLNPSAKILQISAVKDKGMDNWYSWIDELL